MFTAPRDGEIEMLIKVGRSGYKKSCGNSCAATFLLHNADMIREACAASPLVKNLVSSVGRASARQAGLKP
ncbi:MAG: hypothetical protein WA056_01050, partial [Gallionella sp.]